MRHLFLQFNYGVEIGAHLAYMGHYWATKDAEVLRIANEEVDHQQQIIKILAIYGKKPSLFFNIPFTIIGKIIQILCYISPKIMLDSVARIMEKFAIISYHKLARLYPEHKMEFAMMALHESQHEHYFKTGIKPRRGFFDKAHYYYGPKDWVD